MPSFEKLRKSSPSPSKERIRIINQSVIIFVLSPITKHDHFIGIQFTRFAGRHFK